MAFSSIGNFRNKSSIKTIFIFALFIYLFNTSFSQIPNIILGRPTDSSITLSILNNQISQTFVEYGLNSGALNSNSVEFTNTAGVAVEFELNNLLPNTKYYYRLKYKSPASTSYSSTPEYSFYTQRAVGSTYTFTLEADEHLYDKKGVKNMYNITLDNQAADKPDFMLSLGDIFGDDHEPLTITSGALDTLHKDYRPFLGRICHSIPFYICLGNHEGENDYYASLTPPNNLMYWATQWRKFYYPNPFPNSFYSGNVESEPFGINYPENYYAWTWGDALFVVLDVYRDESYNTLSSKPGNWNWTLGLTQYSWLKNTLEGSTAKYKFVFAHHIRGQGRGGITNATQFEWGGLDGGVDKFSINRPGWAKPIHQLFVDNGVNVFFQGHDHVFAHEVLDGVTYQSLPMAADSTYIIGKLANASAYTSDTLEGTGHIKVVVSPSDVQIDFIRAYLPADTLSGIHKNREVAFTYKIYSNALSSSENYKSKESLIISPNPASDVITLKLLDNNNKINSIYIRNVLGSIVLQTDTNEIDVKNLPNGIYFVSVFSENGKYDQKIIINHE